jgi:predicted Zn-dependent peptidase
MKKMVMKLVGIYLLCFVYLFSENITFEKKIAEDTNGFMYEYVTNDPTNTRIYTLENGLKVYLSENKEKPRIFCFVAVKTGGKNDPAETTGLAHYFEHMMFKGTENIGTLNWEKEKPLIEKISALFELHRNTADPNEKRKIYSQIDSLSTLASTYAIPSEYNKLVSSIGAKNTNAWTSYESTVYVNDIPANELEKYLKIESERFTKPVLRLFHTELETVYEEFNMSQDSDESRMFEALLSSLFEKHPYGTQTILGKGEHLKNPSMVNIMNYFATHYVPNNMAICLAGDLDYEKTMVLIDKYWHPFSAKPIPDFTYEPEEPITEPIVKEIYGPDAESVMFAFRFDGSSSEDALYLDLINSILYNGRAGLIDLELVQKQKILSGYSWQWLLNDYGMHMFGGSPREGQSLDEVKELLLNQIEKIKKGEFEEWMLTAAINNKRLSQIQRFEENWRAYFILDSFTSNRDWADVLKKNDELEKISRQDIIDFANKHYHENYVIAYKYAGKDTTIMKVEKPEITPIVINRDTASLFFKEITEMESEIIEPAFVNYRSVIAEKKLNNGVDVKYIKNRNNELFSLAFLVEAGTNQNPQYKDAVEYLQLLGTKNFNPQQFQQELYKNGLSINFWCEQNRTFIIIYGLDKSLEKGLELLYELMANAQPDSKTYDDYVAGVIKKRSDDKLNKDTIFWSALYDYARYCEKSPYKNVVSSVELKKLKPQALIKLINEFLSFKHSILYYGPRELDDVATVITANMPDIKKYRNPPKQIEPKELPTQKPKVYFVNYDMVQMYMIMLSKLDKLNVQNMPMINLFNEYFDGDMSKLVFQEIREAQGLAYATGARYTTPDSFSKSHYLFTYIMTQPDKFIPALNSMKMLLNEMPRIDKNFTHSVESIRKKIQTERIIKSDIFWNWLSNKDRGIDFDIRESIYHEVGKFNLDDMYDFYQKEVKDKPFVYLIMADKEMIDFEELKKLGEVEEVTLEQIFGF